MRLKNFPVLSFRELGRQLGLKVMVSGGRRLVVVSPMWRKCLSADNQFCTSAVAAGGLGEVQTEKFRALRGCRVVLFPDTDPECKAYSRWCDAARLVEAQPWWEGCPPIYVSPMLEELATAEEKERKIDLVDYVFHHQLSVIPQLSIDK